MRACTKHIPDNFQGESEGKPSLTRGVQIAALHRYVHVVISNPRKTEPVSFLRYLKNCLKQDYGIALQAACLARWLEMIDESQKRLNSKATLSTTCGM